METTRTKTSRADQDTGAAIVGIYALGAGALVATVFLAVPRSSGLRFLEVWTAIALLFPLGIAWDRGGKPAAWVATLCKFEDGRGEFQNRPLRDVLLKYVPQLAESSW